LQKLKGFAEMNASQLLEAKQEADRKMKRNMDFLAAVLAGQSGGPQ
jgi:hypothetical protein